MQDRQRVNTKSDTVYEFIKEQIHSGVFKPGDRIIIREISRQLGVSDIPVREAVKKLASEGFLEVKSHSGARVAALNIQSLEEIFLIRVELETLATRLAVRSATPEEVAQLEACVRKMEESYQNNDMASYTAYNREFHQLLYRASHAPYLVEIIENLYVRSDNSKKIFQHDPERWRKSNAEHREIVEAILAKDEERAAKVIRYQKESGFRGVLNALRLSQSLLGG
ncbi:GntR family transcriptional regulator [Brevibacillus composti]|uniref:GntR family transcriptional regulator n=1 Tax=Brevibacillus composti TaxID=2796470 RepID=A0A7T5JN51_9BACL|nr:GntR family transcriptional regulator [Brevibacillus composti]QQE73741.1 GntR family transcriptional regulator [Brevibacillus composti]QUO40824.1 GntR family transcriptional regulator [Brevibacillus composti]